MRRWAEFVLALALVAVGLLSALTVTRI